MKYITIALCSLIIFFIQLILNKFSGIDHFLSPKLFIAIAIFLIYWVSKAVIAHKKVHFHTSFYDRLLERIIFPGLVLVLTLRFSTLPVQLDIFLEQPLVWILIGLLLDPLNIIKKTLIGSPTVQSGLMLKPLIKEEPKSEVDYVPTYLTLMMLYFALWY